MNGLLSLGMRRRSHGLAIFGLLLQHLMENLKCAIIGAEFESLNQLSHKNIRIQVTPFAAA